MKEKLKNQNFLDPKISNVFPGGVNHNIRFFEPYPFFSNNKVSPSLTLMRINIRIIGWDIGH